MKPAVWKHFVILLALALLLPALSVVGASRTRLLDEGWSVVLHAAALYSVRELLFYVPLAAGIAVGTSVTGRCIGAALRMLLVTLVLMIAVDVWAAPAAERVSLDAAQRAPHSWPIRDDVRNRMRSSLQTAGAIRTAARLVHGDVGDVRERREAYPFDHPRTTALDALTRLGYFMLPFIVLGLVIGLNTWISARVIFRRPRDGVVARWLLAWLLVPAAVVWVTGWVIGMHHRALFRGDPLWMPLVAYIPFLLVAALGWWAAARLPLPEEDESVAADARAGRL